MKRMIGKVILNMYKNSYSRRIISVSLMAIICGLFSTCQIGNESNQALILTTSPLKYQPGIKPTSALLKLESITENRLLVGQSLIIALRWDENGKPITKLGPREIKILKDLQPGGVSLFAVNLETVEQTRELIREIRGACEIPPFIAIDEEGGRVSRLATSRSIKAVRIPPASELGQAGYRAVWHAYDIIGQELASLGVNMDFAPVADLSFDKNTDIVGDRAFSKNPYIAAEMVVLAVQALQKNGICSVLKHYPGHGRSDGDSHFGLQKIQIDWETLTKSDLVPFIAAINAKVAGIMTAHIEYPKVDSANVPASMSKILIADKLRKKFDFRGLIITDAMDMRGILSLGSVGSVSVASLNAGVDMLLCPENAIEIRDALFEALNAGKINKDQLKKIFLRILAVKNSFGLFGAQTNKAEDAFTVHALGSTEQKILLAKKSANF